MWDIGGERRKSGSASVHWPSTELGCKLLCFMKAFAKFHVNSICSALDYEQATFLPSSVPVFPLVDSAPSAPFPSSRLPEQKLMLWSKDPSLPCILYRCTSVLGCTPFDISLRWNRTCEHRLGKHTTVRYTITTTRLQWVLPTYLYHSLM